MILRDYITAILALAILLGGAYAYKRAGFVRELAYDEQKQRFNMHVRNMVKFEYRAGALSSAALLQIKR